MSRSRRTSFLMMGLAALVVLTTPVREARSADVQIDEKEVCLACHDLTDGTPPKVVHAPAESGDCSSCHNPHVSRFSALLRDRPAPLCVSCHEDVKKKLTGEVIHQPVEDGRCAECHDPHGSDHDGLLKAPAKDLCGLCHTEIVDWESRKNQHQPFRNGRCETCHAAHASDHPGLLKARTGPLCKACHPMNASFREKHGNYPVEQAACHQCHDPHASSQAGLFRESEHPPFAERDCTTCHAAPGAADPFALVARQDELCGGCHQDQVDESRNAAFPHISAGGTECTTCHNPHTGDGSSLLKGSTEAVCLGCHDPGGAKSGLPGRYLSHAEGVECTDCHAPHGATQPVLMRGESIAAVCESCHEHQHGIRHPQGEEVRDPRSGQPMDCVSCHGLHDAPFEKYLVASEERDLCLGCHKDIGEGR